MHHLIFLCSLVSVIASAQSVSTRMSARAAGMGNSGFTLSDESALFQNVGSLAFNKSPSVFFAHEIVPDLIGANRTAAALTIPASWGTLAAGAFRFGDDVYSEQMLSLGFGHRLENTSLGLKANYYQYRADGFGTRTAFTVDVGGLTQVTPEWTVGAGIFNVTQASLAENEPMPTIFVAAVSWQTAGGPLITIETEKRLQAPLRVRAGLEIPLRQKIFIRMGVSLQPINLNCGVGAQTLRSRLDFSTAYTEVFGFMCQASLSYRLTRKTAP